MSRIFGIFNYGKIIKHQDISNIIGNLGRYSSIRGTDATGIAYLKGSKIIINKANKSAINFDFNLHEKPKVIIGHTRSATQDDADDNINNQSFLGCKNFFALAHDSIITNYKTIRKTTIY